MLYRNIVRDHCNRVFSWGLFQQSSFHRLTFVQTFVKALHLFSITKRYIVLVSSCAVVSPEHWRTHFYMIVITKHQFEFHFEISWGHVRLFTHLFVGSHGWRGSRWQQTCCRPLGSSPQSSRHKAWQLLRGEDDEEKCITSQTTFKQLTLQPNLITSEMFRHKAEAAGLWQHVILKINDSNYLIKLFWDFKLIWWSAHKVKT